MGLFLTPYKMMVVEVVGLMRKTEKVLVEVLRNVSKEG